MDFYHAYAICISNAFCDELFWFWGQKVKLRLQAAVGIQNSMSGLVLFECFLKLLNYLLFVIVL